MELLHFLVRDAIIANLKATTKQAAIREIVRTIQDTCRLAEVDTEVLIDSFMQRESLSSTAFASVACPHGGNPAVEKTFGTVALSRAGVTFDAVNGDPVHVISCCFIHPTSSPVDRSNPVKSTTRFMRNPSCEKMNAG